MTKLWIPATASALILTVFILGCYQKISHGGNPDFENKADQRMTLAEKDLNKFGSSMRIVDGEAESHYKMALYFQKRKKHKFAIEELKKAIQLNPLFTKAYNAMGVSYDKLGNYSQAASCYRSALKLDPKLDYVHNNLGYSYLLKNDLDAAIDAFQKAIEINDNNKRYRSNLGLAYIMKDEYDKAYNQFRIVEGDSGAKGKLAYLLDKFGKEKPEHDFTKYSNSEPNREKLVRKTPVVIKRKIYNEETKSLTKADNSVQKPEDQEIINEHIPLSDKKTLLNSDKDVSQIDETGISKGYSRDTIAEKPESADFKKVKSPENIDKDPHRELQNVSKHHNQTAYPESIDANPVQITAAEDQKPSTLNEESTPSTKTETKKAKDFSISAYRTYSLSAVELVSDPVAEKNASAEFVKPNASRNENANSVQNTAEPKIIEVKESYNQDTKETATVTPARSKYTKSDLIGATQTILKEKQPPVYAQATPTITSPGRKAAGEIVQSGPFQWNDQSNLASKEINLMENYKSEDITVENEIIVANGNGVNGAAGRFRAYLKSKGFKVAKITNANSFDHASTKIFYCNGGKKDVYKLLEQIPFVLDQRSIIELKSLKNRFKIIIGKDQIKYDKTISKIISRKPKS